MVSIEIQKNTPMPFFSTPYVVSCETRGKDVVYLQGCGGNVSSKKDIYELSDLNETPGWKGGRPSQEILRPGLCCRGKS